MKRVALILVCAGFGCQWAFPLHHEEGDPGSGPEGGSDGSLPEAASIDGSDAQATPDSAQPGADADDCTREYTSSATCNACLNQHCCTQLNDCFARNPECEKILACITQCGFDFTCPQKCQDAHPNGLDDFNRANVCSSSSCNLECQKDGG